MTRLESGKKQREFSEVDIVDIARLSIESVQPGADERGIVIHLETPDPVLLQADRDEIEIVTNNLISNAVKYNRDNGEVFVRITREGGHIVLSVRDTGIGMTKEETEKLFSDFVRIKNAKTRNILGSGLGLSIVKKIAQLYDGSVSVESEPDVGSTFTATFSA
jgi:signal transduction histidine kinase